MAKKRVKHSVTHKQRALQYLQAFGWLVADVEQTTFYPGKPLPTRHDMWGIFDLLAINHRDSFGTLALQVTSESNVAGHVMKILANKNALVRCLRVGWRVELWGVRDRPLNGSPVLGRTFFLNSDGTIEVVEKSCVLEGK